MSTFHSSAQTLPPPNNLQLDLNKYLSHYLIFRSFQHSWTIFPFIHIPIYCPVFGDLATGDHYLEYKHKYSRKTQVSLLISICPGFNFKEPLFDIRDSTLFNGYSIYCLCNLPPKSLPIDIEEFIIHNATTETPLILFAKGINLFLEEFHQSAYPPNTPPQLIKPLEDY